VNTQAGALSLVASRLFQTPGKAEGQDPHSRKMDNGSPEVLESNLEASPAVALWGNKASYKAPPP